MTPHSPAIKLYVPTMVVAALAVCLHWQAPDYVVYMLPFIAVTIHGVGRTYVPGKKTRGIGGPLGETIVGVGLLALVAHVHPLGNDAVYWLASVVPIVAFGVFFAMHWEPKTVSVSPDAVSMAGIWCGMVMAPLWVFLPADAVWGIMAAAAMSVCCGLIVRRRRTMSKGLKQ